MAYFLVVVFIACTDMIKAMIELPRFVCGITMKVFWPTRWVTVERLLSVNSSFCSRLGGGEELEYDFRVSVI
jgi:hypothetical protein